MNGCKECEIRHIGREGGWRDGIGRAEMRWCVEFILGTGNDRYQGDYTEVRLFRAVMMYCTDRSSWGPN